MTLQYLVLFDIDGTLLRSDGSGREATRRALQRVYGAAGPIDTYAFAGRTDREIVRDLLTAAGLPPGEIWARFDAYQRAIAEELRARLASGEHHVRPCPGAPRLVGALAARDDVLLGLLTGNLEPTARLKLQAAGYDPARFRVGAFGGESTERADLVPVAVERARALTGTEFRGKQIVIIGDAPADVLCGQPLGVRTIGVLTGWHDRADLEAVSADAIFDDLTDVEAVMEAAFGG